MSDKERNSQVSPNMCKYSAGRPQGAGGQNEMRSGQDNGDAIESPELPMVWVSGGYTRESLESCVMCRAVVLLVRASFRGCSLVSFGPSRRKDFRNQCRIV